MSLINNLNNVDFVIMFFTLLFMLYGYARGFTKEVLSILSLFISFYFSINFYPFASEFIKKYITMIMLADSIAFGLIFIVAYSLVSIFSSFLAKSVKNTSLRIIDKNFGIIIGFFKSIVVLSLIFIILSVTLWKKNIPILVLEAKSTKAIIYSSSLIVDVIPEEKLKKILTSFGVTELSPFHNKKSNNSGIEKYTEPAMKTNLNKEKQGYTTNDNESLDRLFNIENNE